jgi:uncharacterized pyridoxamine 5'-phosphate oxidase family protein
VPEPVRAAVIAADTGPSTEPLPWAEVRERFVAERSYWLATTTADGRPQVRPMLAVWLGDTIYSTTSPAAAKGRNLQRHPECSLAARALDIDIVVEGTVSWADDRDLLQRIASAYHSKYDWPVTVTTGNMFDAPYGAPTAGSPPYRAYGITPRAVYAFGTGGDLGVRSTRFLFPRP